MSGVLLGQSYFLRFDPKLWASMQPYAPLGTLYAAAVLRQGGHEVALFDAMLASSTAEWDAALERTRPAVAVLYEDNFNYLSKMCLGRMRQAAICMIGMARARGCTVAVGGADASDHPDVYLSAGASFVLLGEGEITLAELVDRLSGRTHTSVEAIAGLQYRDAGGTTRTTGRRSDIQALDALPLPAWDLVDVDRYRAIWLERHGRFSMNVVTTRGCPYHCNWCAKPIWGQRYNVRSPEHVVDEIVWLERQYAPDHVWFADDILGLKPGWLPRFADLIEARGVRIRFKSLSRADLLMRPGEVDALRRAGAETVWIGAESGSQRILDAMEKGVRVEEIVEACRRLREAGIRVGFFLQFGYPGEDRQDIARTLALVRRARPDDIGVSVSYPLPGTKFYDAVRAGFGDKRHWDDSADLAMLYRGPYTTPFYRALHTVVHKEFRALTAWRELGDPIRRPWRLRARHARRALAMFYHLATLPAARVGLEWQALRRHPPEARPAWADR